jgi:hypothetical protein
MPVISYFVGRLGAKVVWRSSCWRTMGPDEMGPRCRNAAKPFGGRPPNAKELPPAMGVPDQGARN